MHLNKIVLSLTLKKKLKSLSFSLQQDILSEEQSWDIFQYGNAAQHLVPLSQGTRLQLSNRERYKEKKTDTSQNSSVQISDDGKGSFTVLMTGLRLTDSGWYFCSVGKLEAPVQLYVSENSQVSVTEPKPEVVTSEGFVRISSPKQATVDKDTSTEKNMWHKEERFCLSQN
uniref:Immunoglobulin V-set domain-containing protein n=1 Tax=Cyprinus carpio TaxID=7962 RepID=A0A8C2HX81_CYPCA